MIIVKLGGGLGNQMFQYALGRSLSIRHSEELLLDISTYNNHKNHIYYRTYGLAHFKTNAEIATQEEINRVKFGKHPLGKLCLKIKKAFEYRVLRNHHVKFDEATMKKSGDVYLEGYWQSYKYFKNIREHIIKELSLKNSFSPTAKDIADKIQKSMNSVSLHVRRGDYVATPKAIEIYGTHCNQDYYEKALDYLVKNNKGGKPFTVFVFSDDIEWVKNNIRIPHNTIYVPETSAPDYERMMLMSLCQNHIIANSTFGWWPAWLDNKPDKIVIAPSVWIPGIDLPIDDIIPPEWIRI